ncbi:MAG: Y-family DNA polymerase [Bacilli bacterium]|nr:Y-family DNA polymerase [Bacilli bacterium]
MDELKINRNIICIDLKSFFASCECIERNLDPFKTPLVVAEPNRQGAITLAVTPYLKSLGVKSRGRIYEIPKHINYITARPRMSLYINKSKEVINTYLEYISIDDLHIYSIDECFLDVTNYLKLYNKTTKELAKDILKSVYKNTGLYATAGIGPNLLLAKVSMDIEAKHNKDFIAEWTYNDIKEKLWTITPLSNMWGIGKRMEKNLNNLNIKTIGDLATYDKLKLKEKFGVIGEELWYHANGIDLSKISDFKREAKEKSISNSQVLFKDYYNNEINLIIKETTSIVTKRLRKENLKTGRVSLHIGYSKDITGGFSVSKKLDSSTDNEDKIYKILINIFNCNYEENTPIRKVGISLSKLEKNNNIQLNLFNSIKEIEENKNIYKTIDKINDKFGNNSILKATSLLSTSTIKSRNSKIGGHNAK